jgi:hypothetical protein
VEGERLPGAERMPGLTVHYHYRQIDHLSYGAPELVAAVADLEDRTIHLKIK